MPVLPSFDCCEASECDSESTVQVPGPQGEAGADGADGADGVSAFTVTTAQFTMPAELASVSVEVANSTGIAVGQIVFVKNGGAVGFFEVTAKADSTHLTLKNLEDTTSNVYASNSTAGTVFASGATVNPAGPQGEAGPICLNGTGSPEGVVSADPFRFYFDDSSLALYIKLTGTGNTGWQILLSA